MIYRSVMLFLRQRYWELPIFIAGSALAVIGAFSIMLYLQNIAIINELGEIFGLRRSISAVPERIVDGDDIVFNGEKVRLNHIDAPELGQCCKTSEGEWQDCGELAKHQLHKQIANQQVHCFWLQVERSYNRPLATCFVGDKNLNRWIVKNGFAFAFRERRNKKKLYYPKKTYLKQEQQAKLTKAGLHSYTELLPPHIYRHQKEKKHRYSKCMHE